LPKAAKRSGLTQALAPYSMKITTLTFLLFLSGAAASQTPSAVTTKEVGQLFAALKQSNCEFSRNGSWYNAQKAADHLQSKYEYLLKKHVVTSTESFIELAATKSSMSGKPYQVRCGKTAPVSSNSWFKIQLNAIRSGGRR
jgi:hypothetical protein